MGRFNTTPLRPIPWPRGDHPDYSNHFRTRLPSRRVRSDIFTREQALELAKAFARAERDKDGL